jgi:threonyl-tRNA synthetase
MPENNNHLVRECEHRQDVQVRFNDGRVFCAPAGTRLESFVRKAFPPQGVPVVGALVNGRLAELSEPLIADVDVEPISMATEDGMRMYHRALTLLLEVVARELFNAHIAVDHSLTFGGLFCRVLEREPFSDKEIAQIEDRMCALIAEDLPITRETMPVAEVIANAHAQGDESQVLLLSKRGARRRACTSCAESNIISLDA